MVFLCLCSLNLSFYLPYSDGTTHQSKIGSLRFVEKEKPRLYLKQLFGPGLEGLTSTRVDDVEPDLPSGHDAVPLGLLAVNRGPAVALKFNKGFR